MDFANSTSRGLTTRHQKYPLQLVDVVVPRFQLKVGDPKTKHVKLEAIAKALKAQKIKFKADILKEMFDEADFESRGFLIDEHLKAAVTGRYPLRKYKMAEWMKLVGDVLGTATERLDPAMDMSLTHRDIARRRAKTARAAGAFETPLPPASPQPTSRPTSAHSGRIAIESRTRMSGGSMAGNSRPPSPSLRRLQSSLSNQTGHAPRDRRASSASSAAARAAFMSSGRTYQDEVTVALQSDSFDADCRLHPQYQEYLAAIDQAYGQENHATWKPRNQIPKAPETPSDTARRMLSLTNSYPFDESKSPSSLSKTRQKLLGIKPASLPLLDLYHMPLDTHDLDRSKTLGKQISASLMSQTFPRRPPVVQTGLPRQDYMHVSSHVPPPKTFGSQPWWN